MRYLLILKEFLLVMIENRFLFVLGSNWQLSIAELDNFLKCENSPLKGKIIDYSGSTAIVELAKAQENKKFLAALEETQFILGGCQKIAKIYEFIDIRTIREAFPERIENVTIIDDARQKLIELLEPTIESIFPNIKNNKFFFAVSIYPNLFDEKYYSEVIVKHLLPFLNKHITLSLRKKGARKILFYKYPEKNIQSGNLNPIFPHTVIKYELFKENRAEIIFGFTEEGVYIARSFTVDNPNFKKHIDENRPNKEFKATISPKLALIMLNFLNLYDKREKKKVLDPFVGNGTILMLALVQDFQIYGTDKDRIMVKNTVQNINWLQKDLQQPIIPQLEKRIFQSDIKVLSNKFEENFFDGVCTEPWLGPFYAKEKPNSEEADKIIKKELIPLYKVFFKQTSMVLKKNGRICTTAPIISTAEELDLQLNLEEIANSHNLKLIPLLDSRRLVNKSNQRLQFPKSFVKNFIDAKRDQVIKRKIYLFEKQ